jgi:tRNA nucleotidyltransferase (CCA-adding enzyme)
MRELANRIIEVVKYHGATEALFVGGCVRDLIIGVQPKDYDIEVYGLPFDTLMIVLGQHFDDVKAVGESFGVIKVNNEIDVSVPRRENKVGVGHKGFEVTADPNMTPMEAAARRDFTINSMMMKSDGTIIDPYNGQEDIKNKVLRATSNAYSEDPLRVLRGMQFAGRFGMDMEWDTVGVSKKMDAEFDTLAKERVFEEWWKWATKSIKPSKGLDVLMDTSWAKHFPPIPALFGTAQDPIWHPEGNVYFHTGHVCDAAAEIATRENLNEGERAILLFSALCHDFGKPTTTGLNEEGRISAHGHDEAGIEPTRQFLIKIGAPHSLFDMVLPLVQEHMAHTSFKKGEKVSTRVVRRLANRLAPSNVKMWSLLCEADHSGRPPLPKHNPVLHWVEVANSLDLASNKPQPILMGRHLLEIGLTPGPKIGNIVKCAFEAQLDEAFNDVEGALAWCRKVELI